MTTPTFAIAGVAGFVAPRHLEAIQKVGGVLTSALDLRDAVGILDKYNKDADFFTDAFAFGQHLKLTTPDYLVVCTPNDTHAAYIRAGLLAGCNVICEKPLVVHPKDLLLLAQLQTAADKQVYPVLQLRHALRPNVVDFCASGSHTVEVEYVTPRGKWYHQSWKADPKLSGGLITNIGIHIFDALIQLFGRVKSFDVYAASDTTVAGVLVLTRAAVRWTLSIESTRAPARIAQVDGVQLDLSGGFADAHTKVYQDILAGKGLGMATAAPAIQLCYDLNKRAQQVAAADLAQRRQLVKGLA